VADYLRENPAFDRVGFVLFGNQSYQAYVQAAGKELGKL
jgi:hypothetical protein